LLGSRRSDGWAVLSLVFLPQPGLLASADTEGAVLIWDVSKELSAAAPLPKELGRGVRAPAETGQWARRLPLEDRLGGVAFSPDGKTLAAGTQHGVIKLFDFATGKVSGTLEGHTSAVRAILYTPDGKTMYSTAYLFDGKELPVRAWDLETRKPLWARGKTGTFPEDLALTLDGKILYTTGNGGIPSWDARSGEPLPRIKAYDGYTGAMAVSPDGKYLMVGGFKAVVLWDLQTNKQVRTWTATENERDNVVNALAFSPDGKTAVAAPVDGKVRAWDVASGERRLEWKMGGGASTASYSPQGDLIAFVGDPIISGHVGRVSVCDAKTGKELLLLVGNGPKIAWSPDGRWLASADVKTWEKDNSILIWDIKSLLNR
jgi:WD40 repeat protein